MDAGGFSEYTWDGEKLELIWGQIHLDFDFGHQLVRFLGGLMRCVVHISYKQQVEGLQDINQLVGLLVPLLCDVPDFVSVIRWLISLTNFILLHFQEAPVFIEVSYS
ncbi:hypothetical protein PS1_018967 [Malus domestica]